MCVCSACVYVCSVCVCVCVCVLCVVCVCVCLCGVCMYVCGVCVVVVCVCVCVCARACVFKTTDKVGLSAFNKFHGATDSDVFAYIKTSVGRSRNKHRRLPTDHLASYTTFHCDMTSAHDTIPNDNVINK